MELAARVGRHEAANADAHRRLHDRLDDHGQRVTVLEVEAREWRREVREDLHEIRDAVKDVRNEVERDRQGTISQRIAYVGAAALVLAALVGGIVQVVLALSNAGPG